VPHLSLHTIADEAVPVEHELAYAARVRAAGCAHLLRTAYIDRVGHTEFTAAETVAAVEALSERIGAGRWGSIADTANLQQRAVSLGLDGAAFTDFAPGGP
jgi:hypothetical protein